MSTALAEAEAELSAAEADLARLRAENHALAEAFREDPTDDAKEGLRRAAASLTAARERVDAARARVKFTTRTGSPYGVIAEGGRVYGTIALALSPGITRAEREQLIDEALTETLADCAKQLGLVISTSPSRFVRERPGRDADGKTILDVMGRAEGDVLIPGTVRNSRGY